MRHRTPRGLGVTATNCAGRVGDGDRQLRTAVAWAPPWQSAPPVGSGVTRSVSSIDLARVGVRRQDTERVVRRKADNCKRRRVPRWQTINAPRLAPAADCAGARRKRRPSVWRRQIRWGARIKPIGRDRSSCLMTFVQVQTGGFRNG